MSSSLVFGKIWHARMKPVKHIFEYPIYFFQLNVDELSQFSNKNIFFSLNRWNIFSLYEKNYLRPGHFGLRAKVENLLSEHGIHEKPETIELVTQLRYFGWVFNPVSFFFCRDHEGKLIAVIADVNNTFGEGHAYLLKDFCLLNDHRVDVRTPKVFHVSPFFDCKGEYRFEFTFHSEKVNIALDYLESGELKLASSWQGDCRAFQTRDVFLILLRYPFGGWLTIMRIHFQAIVLFFFKKLPIFKKPEPNHFMTLRRK